jgi:hypothetical protein
MVIISVPRVIFQAGLSQPMWLMAGFGLLAIPAAGLGAARPLTPGGPRPKTSFVAIANTGAVLSMLSGGALIWWTGSSLRSGMMRELPAAVTDTDAWIADLNAVAGADVLAVVCAALWIVLVMRLPIVTWLRAIAASAAFFTLVVVSVAMAMSNAGTAQIGMTRSLGAVDDGRTAPHLLLGTTPHHSASIVVRDRATVVELRNYPDVITVSGRMSIVEYLRANGAAE